MKQINAPALAGWLTDADRPPPLLLDVRETWEFKICHVPGAINIPMELIPARLQELDEEQDIVCICHHGMRSANVAMFLHGQGFQHLYNLQGGVAAWAAQVDPGMPQY